MRKNRREKKLNKKREEDIRFMKEALRLAESVRGRTSPDPMVGAVVVKKGRVVGKGYHAEVGTPHAESFAIMKAGKAAEGATLYLNLEPCCHYGNNPPCTEKIITAGIKRVVAAMKDPNPLVCGRGFKELRDADVKVGVGLLEKEAKKLNEAFIKHITTGMPFVILKSAVSLDGKIATKAGESKWITGKEARGFVHYLRNSIDAVMVGKNTIIADDPELTVREIKGRRKNPIRIVLDGLAQIPPKSKVLSKNPQNTIVVVSDKAGKSRILKIIGKGAEVLMAKSRRGEIDLKWLMKELGRRNIMNILLEGGGKTNAGALSQGIVDKVYFFIAPKIIGGEKALTPVEGEGISSIKKALNIRNLEAKKIGSDILLQGYVNQAK